MTSVPGSPALPSSDQAIRRGFARFHPRRAAIFTLPLVLAPPTLFLGGQRAITLPEIIVFLAGVSMLLLQTRPPAKIPPVVLVYVVALCLGWLGALLNSFPWHVPIGPGNASFLYMPFMAILASLVGRYSTVDMEEIAIARTARLILYGVALFAIAYPFMSFAARQLAMLPFYGTLVTARLMSPRFPGVGINANTYAFMVYAVLLFAFNAYLERKASGLLPLAAGVIIIAAASRTVIGLALMSCLVLLGSRFLRSTSGVAFRSKLARAARRRALVILVVLGSLTGAAIVYGALFRDVFTAFARFEEIASGRANPLGGREELWLLGWERVKLAPVLGIPRNFSLPEDDIIPLYNYTPHNEFLFYWTTTGLLGLLAHIFIVAVMFLKNLRHRTGMPWLLLYGGMAVQMLFDSVFQGPRVAVFAFMIIGLNLKALAELKARRAAGLLP